jgi:hypothetical protein
MKTEIQFQMVGGHVYKLVATNADIKSMLKVVSNCMASGTTIEITMNDTSEGVLINGKHVLYVLTRQLPESADEPKTSAININ